jgi:hypothetical protein
MPIWSIIPKVDGPSIVQKAGNWPPPTGANQPIHTIQTNAMSLQANLKPLLMLGPAEIQFLEYRLDVVTTWPESGKKRAALEAIYFRLNGSPGISEV